MTEYESKLRSPKEAAQLVKSGDWVDYGQGNSFPEAFDRALAARRSELCDIKVRSAVSLKPVRVVEDDPEGETFTFHSWHFSAIDRAYADRGRCFYIPMLFRHCGSYYARGCAPVDVAAVSVCPMDEDGFFSFGLVNACQAEVLAAAKTVIVEVIAMPRIPGLSGDRIHISQVDAVIESAARPGTIPSRAITEADRQIAAAIFPAISDGCTLQIGIGGVPDALGRLIAGSPISDIRMHTEFLGDAYLSLYEKGKVRPGGIFSTCFGSEALYDFLAQREDIRSAPMAFVNDPSTIGAIDRFVSINGCLACDLTGQVSSESVGLRQISGTGGQLDFVTGVYSSEGGRSFLAMHSTFTDSAGVLRSNVLPFFSGGEIITTPRTQAACIVTEYGIAELSGKSTWERARALVSIAHPDFREELIQSAIRQKIWR